MARIGFRQALAEVVAVNLAGVNTSRLNTWRSLGPRPGGGAACREDVRELQILPAAGGGRARPRRVQTAGA
jgi:hypothetical protein